jgi:methylated-DNA-[protein]-cysteine S-methyltransferase
MISKIPAKIIGNFSNGELLSLAKLSNQNAPVAKMPHATFSTPFGLCAIAWNEVGLTRFLLPDPERRPGQVETPPPSWVSEIIDRVMRHLEGEVQDFSDVPFDFSRVPEFVRAVLRATLMVKPGHTATYGELATAIGQSTAVSRAVGTALGGNPWPLLIPCHRIVSAAGKMTGFSGPGGVATKVKLLALEGAQLLAE